MGTPSERALKSERSTEISFGSLSSWSPPPPNVSRKPGVREAEVAVTAEASPRFKGPREARRYGGRVLGASQQRLPFLPIPQQVRTCAATPGGLPVRHWQPMVLSCYTNRHSCAVLRGSGIIWPADNKHVWQRPRKVEGNDKIFKEIKGYALSLPPSLPPSLSFRRPSRGGCPAHSIILPPPPPPPPIAASILNKLTLEKFQPLSDQLIGLLGQVTDVSMLDQVINQVGSSASAPPHPQ